MPEATSVRRTRLLFMALFLVFYMTDAAGGYLMLYLRGIGFSTLQMGLLTSVAAAFALSMQPTLGRLADRASTRNRVLMIALAVTAVLAPMLRLSQAFGYILCVYTCYLLARNLLHPLTDTITLSYTGTQGLPFGPIRVMGCVGYATMAAIAGWVAKRNPADPFYLYTLVALASCVLVSFTPRSVGSSVRSRTNPLLLFRRPLLRRYTALAIVFAMTTAFFFQYFSVYFTGELGGDTGLYGLLMSMAALTEIPLIFFLDKLIIRFGTRRMIIAAGTIETLRWLLTALVRDPYVQLGAQAVLGASNMILAVTMILFVNRSMPTDSKATGQATYVMFTSIGSMVVASLLGGALSSALSIGRVFLLCTVVNVITMTWFVWRTRQSVADEKEK